MTSDSSVVSGYAESDCKVTTICLTSQAFDRIFSFCGMKNTVFSLWRGNVAMCCQRFFIVNVSLPTYMPCLPFCSTATFFPSLLSTHSISSM